MFSATRSLIVGHVLWLVLLSALSFASPEMPQAKAETPPSVSKFCYDRLSSLPGKFDKDALKEICSKVVVLDSCHSENGSPIFYYERKGTDTSSGKRILSISLIHGDEHPSGSVNRAWMIRLSHIKPRNTWRVIPIVNPDGMAAMTRYNNRGVDLNRNFPSHDWDRLAQKYWRIKTHKDKRRYPGQVAGSEKETQCIMKQIADFKPNFIISVHTPLGVLDFDGPKVHPPNFRPLPWYGIGTYPGSLGRYMWVDHKVPVLTVELHQKGLQKLSEFDHLQDMTGTVAIQASRLLQKEKN